jgi:hypothetical protein
MPATLSPARVARLERISPTTPVVVCFNTPSSALYWLMSAVNTLLNSCAGICRFPR